MASEGSILGVLTDFVKCVREMVLNGNTVKIANLAIFKATVEANGLEVLYDAETDKTVTASIGELKSGENTGGGDTGGGDNGGGGGDGLGDMG